MDELDLVWCGVVWGRERTDLQLLHPVLTFGLLVLARRCLGSSAEDSWDVVGDTDDGEEVGRLCRWWLTTSADMVGQVATNLPST